MSRSAKKRASSSASTFGRSEWFRYQPTDSMLSVGGTPIRVPHTMPKSS